MNVSTTTPAEPLSPRPLTVRDVEASCAAPVLFMFLASAVWLVLSSIFGLVASVKLHSPTLLAASQWLSYGHVRPAATNAFVYGFASQGGLAVALWLLCRLGRAKLFAPLGVIVATIFWNLAVVLGIWGIMRGDTTGFELAEFPNYAAWMFFAAYLVIAVCAFLTFSRREVEELYPSQWFILGALLWLPWVFTAARMLLVCYPVRGSLQFVVNAWYANAVTWLWLGGLAIAILYYFIPKLSNGELFSRPLAIFAFWTFATFVPFGGLYPGLPLPSWVVSLSIAGAVLTIVPLIANVMNLWKSRQVPASSCSRTWFTTSTVFYAITGATFAAVALCPISAVTVVTEALQLAILYGFVGFALFGAMLHIAPRLADGDLNCAGRGKITWWCTMLGVLIFSGGLLIGGLVQGRKLMDGTIPSLDVMNALKMPLRMSTLGLLLLVVGNVALLGYLFGLTRDRCRACCFPSRGSANVKIKPAKAR